MKTTNRIISIILLFIICLSNVSTPLSYAAEQVASSSSQNSPSTSSGSTTTPIAPPKFKKPDSGSVLGASTSIFAIGTQGENTQTSASKRIPIRVQQLAKKAYETDENVTLAVTNPDNDPFTTSVVNTSGQAVPIPVTETNDGTTTNVQFTGSNEIKPGRYTIKITDEEGDITTQNFTWGVLALNTDKTMYHPGETSDISLAVLDDKGNMVCDASLELRITNTELGIDDTLSTDNKKIQVNDQCQHHDFSLQPDYAAQYTFGKAGNYTLQLSATTDNGTHSITDSVPVTTQIPFDVQRVSATRLYPPNTYPMTFNITAHRDFSGIVTETVPEDFVITPATGSALSTSSGPAANVNSYNNMETVYLNSNDPGAQLQQAIAASSSGGLTMPFKGNYPITQGFGAQMTDPTLQAFYTQYGLAGHDGIDFGVPMGTPLYAVDDGNILQAGPGDYGTTIIIQHGWGESYYGHLSTTAVTVGTHVTKGQLIGYSGESGEATGPHLHFGMKPLSPDMTNGYYGKVDPMPYLPYNQAPEALSTLNPSLAETTFQNVLSASTSGTTDSNASDSAIPTISPTEQASPSATPVVSQQPTPSTSSGSTTTSIPTPTEDVAPLFQIQPASASANENFSVLDKQILMSEQLANNAQTEKVKVITWNVSLKKGESTSLGYDYQIPHTSPQFYLLGPMQFYQKGSNKVVFQEQRQWQLASDDVGVEWYSNTTGNPWNGYSWQYRKKLVIDHTQVSADSPTVDFIDSGGDATNTNGGTNLTTATGGFFDTSAGTVVADCSGGGNSETGPCSYKFTSGAGGGSANFVKNNVLSDSGSRISWYQNFAQLPLANEAFMGTGPANLTGGATMQVGVNSSGVLQLWNGSHVALGGSGPTLTAGTWYRIDLSYTITSTTVYSANVYVNGTLAISVTNGTALTIIGTNAIAPGWTDSSSGISFVVHIDDIYVDSGTDLSDIGDIHVTAKRPFSNGTTTTFTPQIGSGGSGYGSGHALQENERPLSTTNGWTGARTTTDEYTIEGASTGDVDISSDHLIADQAWIYGSWTSGTTTCTNPKIINNGTSTNATAITSTTAVMVTNVTNQTTYPAGNTDVGMASCTNASGTHSVNLYEAGMEIAYSASAPNTSQSNFPVLVSLTSDTDLGNFAQSSGNDILFTDSTGMNLLPFEIESYSVTTGVATLVAWVNVSSLSASTDTILYMYYGNPSASSQASTATWNSNYGGVWHMSKNSAVSVNDSTSNNTIGTNHGITTIAGQINNAGSFNGSNKWMTMANNSIFNPGSSSFSVTAWINETAINTGQTVIEHINTADDTTGWEFYLNSISGTSHPGYMALWDGLNDLGLSAGITAGTWDQIVYVKSGTNVICYVNGNTVGTITGVQASLPTTTSVEEIGTDDQGNGGDFNGKMDEVEYSTTALSPGWIKTEYNNQSNPGPGGGDFISSLGNVETDIYAPTLGQLMRHGQWFSAEGQVQPFTF